MRTALTTIKAYAKTALKWGVYLAPITLWAIDAHSAYDLDAGFKAVFGPIKQAFNDYYPTGILISGGIGAFLKRDGDLRDQMTGFAKGALAGWAAIEGVKAIFKI